MPKPRLCIWKCGGMATSRSGICEPCWLNSYAFISAEEYAERKRKLAAKESNPLKVAAGRKSALSRRSADPLRMPAV
jgi:hypothetical protein